MTASRLKRLAIALVLPTLVVTAALVGPAPLRTHATRQINERSPRHPITIRTPSAPPAVRTDLADAHGQPVSIACNTCHATRPADAEARLGKQLTSFHQHVEGKH